MIERRIRLAANGEVTPAGRFEITAITAGTGNGWDFTAAALRDSLPLWDGVPCFVDHFPGGPARGRSVKDLAGVCHNPTWSDGDQGIHLTLRTLGPAGPLVEALGRQMLGAGAGASPAPKVGFSADVLFSAQGKTVLRILKVFELCLVYNPARGGAFVRSLNAGGAGSQVWTLTNRDSTQALPQGDLTMTDFDSLHNPTRAEGAAGEAAAANQALQAARQQMCAYLLEVGLGASGLPAPLTEHVRKQFGGRVFEPGELDSAIHAARTLVSAMTGPAAVAGPRVHAMFNTEDQLQAAVDDLLGADRGPGGPQAARLSGIRELYHLLTGDYELHGGYHPERAQLATTADFSGLVKNALNKVVANQWQALAQAGYNWWERVVRVEHFGSLNDITGTLVGTVGSLPAVAEGAEYTELAIGDSPETASFTKYGGYIPLTLELIDRDETHKLRAYPRELAAAGLRKISALVAAVFTDNAGTGPALADGGALFNSTAATSAGGHANLRTGALSAAEWDTVCTAVYNQPLLVKNAAGHYGSGAKMALNPRYLLVPRALQLAGMKILYPTLENAANIYSQNQQRGQPGDVVTVPEWADANNWAAACDPLIAPAIFVGERFGLLPEIFIAGDELSPAVFMNVEHRLKVRHFLACWVNDFRPLHKSNVA